jgi:hypothetical protein
MRELNRLEENAPTTMGAAVKAITRLSTLSEVEILELVSEGKIEDLFPFRPVSVGEIPEDTVDESELVEASPFPLSREQRATLIQSSMPAKSAGSAKLRLRLSTAPKKSYSEG